MRLKPRQETVLKKIDGIFGELGIRYVLIGAMIPRILIDMREQNVWCEQLGICYHDGLRGFQPPTYIQLPESSYDTMECGDLNGDGMADIVVAGDPVRIFFGQADGFDQIEFSRKFYNIKLGDMNGDGHLDLVGLNIFDLYIFENDGIGNFTERSVNSAPQLSVAF